MTHGSVIIYFFVPFPLIELGPWLMGWLSVQDAWVTLSDKQPLIFVAGTEWTMKGILFYFYMFVVGSEYIY